MGQGVRSHVPEVTLTGFLSRCRSDWKQRDLDAVVEKLAAVGVFKVGELIRLLQEGILNERLTAVGEKRFTAETLRAMRSTGAELDVGPSAQQPGLPDAGLHGDDMSTDSGEEEDLGMHFPGGLNASQGVWASRRPFPAFEQPQTLRRRLCRGLACVERAATEAKRRNRDVTQCLAEVQSDITRISERMQAVRRKQQQQQQQQQRRRSSTCTPGFASPGGDSMFADETEGWTTPRPRTQGEPGPRAASYRGPDRYRRPEGWGRGEGCPPRPETHEGSHRDPLRPSVLPTPPRTAPPRTRGGRSWGSSLRGGPGPRGPAPARRAAPGREARFPRAAQEGFTFGAGAAAHGHPRMPKTPPLNQDMWAEVPEPPMDDPAAKAQETVRHEMLAVRGRSEADRRSFVKRLLVKWHPDRNPQSSELATAVFQFIQQEKEHMLDL
uniref:J domain-containing protein n=1 Tax=Alexandrium monilatum TaxID=311494 RepID=A0A7S4T4G4_9DINO|mmetsp:Transcript_76185/g.235226  ORF Transcript_76185/g.235226 Transcript_76185/m.235226 type:complete len:438 (+) Transcript_76185:109-1422(+)